MSKLTGIEIMTDDLGKLWEHVLKNGWGDDGDMEGSQKCTENLKSLMLMYAMVCQGINMEYGLAKDLFDTMWNLVEEKHKEKKSA